MFDNKNELEAREEILAMVDEYCKKYHNQKQYKEGDRISYASRVYDSKEMMNLVDSALEFWLTSGRYTDEFEKKLGEYLNVKYVSVVNSGSSANLNAFMALTSPLLGERRINRGDEIITVAAGFPTTVTPAIQYGAVPVFVDVTIPQYNIDVTKLEEAYSDKTKAVMIAHTLGNPFDLSAVKEFCDKHNLWLVEDNCDALGSKYTINGEEKFTGTIGDIGTSSFYPPHHMTMGEGGAVYTNNPLLNKCIRSFRDWGRDCVCPSGKDNLCGHRFDKQYGELPLGYDHKLLINSFLDCLSHIINHLICHSWIYTYPECISHNSVCVVKSSYYSVAFSCCSHLIKARVLYKVTSKEVSCLDTVAFDIFYDCLSVKTFSYCNKETKPAWS